MGGEVIVAPSGVPADHPDHYQNIEATMCAKNPKFYGVNQYDNPYNADAYEKTLGPEIWSQTEGRGRTSSPVARLAVRSQARVVILRVSTRRLKSSWPIPR